MTYKRFRNTCLTFYTEPIFPEGKCDYLIVGRETCPSTGTIHWQAYAEFDNPVTMATIKKRFKDNTVHISEKYPDSTQYDCITYCKKEGEFKEYGNKKNQGQRTDLERIAKGLVEATLTLEDVMVEDPELYCKYRNGLKDLSALGCKNASKEFRKINTEVYVGDAGTGKTRKAIEENPNYYILDMASDDKVWFDGYNGESTLIIDDFYGWIKYGQLLRLLDGYQCRLNVKGSFTYARWTKICITSNKNPKDWYEKGLTPALKRRLTKIIHFERSLDSDEDELEINTQVPQ